MIGYREKCSYGMPDETGFSCFVAVKNNQNRCLNCGTHRNKYRQVSEQAQNSPKSLKDDMMTLNLTYDFSCHWISNKVYLLVFPYPIYSKSQRLALNKNMA